MWPAREGDALWLRWGDAAAPQQALIDMGVAATGRALKAHIAQLSEAQRRFALLVITHVDRDHIAGVLSALDAPPDGLRFDDIWFNGWPHIQGAARANRLEDYGPVQGHELQALLQGRPWNAAFDGGAVARAPGQPPPRVQLPGGLEICVLGPTPQRLRDFEPHWREAVEEAIAAGRLPDDALGADGGGLESYGAVAPPVLRDRADLERLADSDDGSDHSEANGSSICLLLRYQQHALLLCGDAFAADVLDGVAALPAGEAAGLAAVKLPHHGSAKNVSRELIAGLDTRRWLISTDGNRFGHPDDAAIARILLHSPGPPELLFNMQSRHNQYWQDAGWQARFGYSTQYGRAPQGYTLMLD